MSPYTEFLQILYCIDELWTSAIIGLQEWEGIVDNNDMILD